MSHEKITPTYFKSLTLKNIRCFENVELNLTGENGNIAQWTLLLGDNGVGKTTLLQCLCWMRPVLVEGDVKEDDLYKPINEGKIGSVITGEDNDVLERILYLGERNKNEFDLEAELWQGVELNSSRFIGGNLKRKDIKTSLTFYFEEDGTLKDNSKNKPNPKEKKTDIENILGEFTQPFIVTYGANRWINLKYLGSNKIQDSLVANLSSKGTPLNDFEEELTTLQSAVNDQELKKLKEEESLRSKGDDETIENNSYETDEARRLRIFKDVIIKVLPKLKTVDDIEIEPPKVVKGEVKDAQVKLRIFDDLIPFSELSLGYQTTLTWVLDLAFRLVNYYSESKDPLNDPAIVLIDEIDLHLHPHWQWTIMKNLSSLFHRTQFIATSHSPLMVQSMPDANFAIVQKTDSGIEIENDPEKVKGWRIDQILNSEYFGFKFSRTPETEEIFQKRDALLLKLKRSSAEEEKLTELQSQISLLPTGTNPEEDEALMHLQKAAELLKREELSKNDQDK